MPAKGSSTSIISRIPTVTLTLSLYTEKGKDRRLRNMANSRKRAAAPEIAPNPNESDPATPVEAGNGQISEASDYEQCREQRIRENRERMQKLGIMDLSHEVKSLNPHKRTPRNYSAEKKTAQSSSPLLRQGPVRRSSRLQNAAPVSYSEVDLKKGKALDEEILLDAGYKPEFYTEEHEKLLGSTEKSWELFKDGYGADGRRIYDPVRGKTCHQCRQKTLGQRTHCSKCEMVQGQFCGDCLFMRYGEHVEEAQQNPNWICPPCRGICNCSLCRQARGWPATGTLYKKVTSLGYKSVAHYLVQTKRAPSESEKNAATPHCAKRSLAFTDTEGAHDNKEIPKCIVGQKLQYDENTAGESEDKKDDKVLADKQGPPRATDGLHGRGLESKDKDKESAADQKGSQGDGDMDGHGLGLESKDEQVTCKNENEGDKTLASSKTGNREEVSVPIGKESARINEHDGTLISMGTSVAAQPIILHVEVLGDNSRSKSKRKIAQPGSIGGRTRSKCKIEDIHLVGVCKT